MDQKLDGDIHRVPVACAQHRLSNTYFHVSFYTVVGWPLSISASSVSSASHKHPAAATAIMSAIMVVNSHLYLINIFFYRRR